MRRILVGAAVVGIIFVPAASAALSRQVVRYDIRARLVPERKTVEGEETLVWRNDSNAAVSDLRFHLYLNAFKNNRTTFMEESGGARLDFKRDKDTWGYCEIRKLALLTGTDLMPAMRYVQPDDANADDQTVMAVALPAPVKPGATVALTIAFTAKLPKVFARSGYSGDFFMVGQWFPKLGVFQDGAWNCHQYHATSEFFADFGVFDVALTVPAKYIVGATGRRTGQTRNADGTITSIHHQEDVHDFAWAACPDFVEFREPFALEEPRVRTDMILLIHRAHLGQKDRYARALRQGLEFYSQNYGPYPYETVTLVDPAPGAAAAGGMEYPTLFTSLTMSWMPRGVHLPEMVTIHEFGHGYWYGIVGSNEFEEAWLDEGINTYSEVKAMARYYGEDRSMIDFRGLKVGDLHFQRLSVISSGRFDPILKNSWQFVSGGSYGLNVYNKAGLMLLTLEKLLGEEVMGRVMRTYFERWKFRHPRTEDFVRVAEDVSGRDLGRFFDQVLHSPDRLDYAISDLKATEIAVPDGVFDGQAAATPSGTKPAARTPKAYRNEVVVARLGEWIFPVDIQVVFDNGETIREQWDGWDRWRRLVYLKTAKVVSAEVDPDRKLVLDVNYVNNSRVLEMKRPAVLRAALGVMTWFQGLLSLMSF